MPSAKAATLLGGEKIAVVNSRRLPRIAMQQAHRVNRALRLFGEPRPLILGHGAKEPGERAADDRW